MSLFQTKWAYRNVLVSTLTALAAARSVRKYRGVLFTGMAEMAVPWETVGRSVGVAVLVVVLFKALVSAARLYHFYSKLRKLPCEPRHWFFGNYDLIKDNSFSYFLTSYMAERLARFPRMMALWGFFSASCDVMVYHPDTVKVVLQSSEPKDLSYSRIQPFLGDGLILSHGSHWARNRKLLTPAFHFDVLKSYFEIYNEAAERFMEKISKEGMFGKRCVGICELVSNCTLNILLRCAFSEDSDSQGSRVTNEYIDACKNITRLSQERDPVNGYIYFLPDWVYSFTSHSKQFHSLCDYVHSVAKEVTNTRRKTLDSGKHVQTRKYIDFLDILLSARDSEGNGLTEEEIRDEVSTFMFAGHDTTSSGTCWTLYSLAKWPEHQDKVYEEIREFMKDRENENITGNDLEHFKYLNLCIREMFRYHSPVPMIGRHLTKDIVIDGFTIPRGTGVTVSIYSLHHNPAVWDRHDEFDPLRFASENRKDNIPFSFLPFSAGPRNCIGQNFALQEMKTILIRVLNKFRVELDPDHKVEYETYIVTHAKNNINLKFIPRENS